MLAVAGEGIGLAARPASLPPSLSSKSNVFSAKPVPATALLATASASLSSAFGSDGSMIAGAAS